MYFINHDFTDVFTGDSYASFVSSHRDFKRIKGIFLRDIGASYIGNLTDSLDRQINLTFYRLSRFNAFIVFHQAHDEVFDKIFDLLFKIAKKVALIFLVAVLIGYILSRSLSANLESVVQGTLRIANGDFQSRLPIKSRDEIGYLAYAVNYMGSKISSLLNTELEKIRFEQELATAQTVQNTFFKETEYTNGALHVASYYTPASECGGDWWGHFDLGEGRELIIIADATGHGVPAALITAMAYATSNLVSQMFREGKIPDNPSEILKRLNALLYNSLQGQLCMTFMAMLFDTNNGLITFSNAGHVFPLLIPQDRNDGRLKARTKKRKWPIQAISSKNKKSSILGIAADSEFEDEEIHLMPGDKFVLYTDGLTEAKNEKGKMWGTRGLVKSLESFHADSSKEIRDKIIKKADDYNAGEGQYEDDLTLVIVEYDVSRVAA